MSETTSAVNVEIKKTVITSGIATVKKEITAPITIGFTGPAGEGMEELEPRVDALENEEHISFHELPPLP